MENSQIMITCPVCSSKLLEKNLNRHLKKVHETSINKKLPTTISKSSSRKTVYKCKSCKKSVNARQMRSHLKEFHEYIPKQSTQLIGVYFEEVEIEITRRRKSTRSEKKENKLSRKDEVEQFKRSVENIENSAQNIRIGLGLESKIKPSRVRREDVIQDTRTRKENVTGSDKSILYAAGFSLKKDN